MAFKLINMPTVPEESITDNMLRQGARSGVRAFESALDVPLGVASLVSRVGEGAAQGLMGIPEKLGFPKVSAGLKGISKFLGDEYGTPEVPEAKEVVSGTLSKILPKDYLKAQNKTEEVSDELISDFIPLVIGKVPVKYAALGATLGNITPFLGKAVGLGETAQTGIKIGTILGTTMLGRSNLTKHYKDLYKQANDAIAPGDKTSVNILKPFLKDISNITDIGIGTPTEKALDSIVKGIHKNTKKGMIPIKNLIVIKQGINELISDIAAPKRLKKLMPTISSKVKDTLKEYGKSNPEFWSKFEAADNIFANLNKKTIIDKVLHKSKLLEHVSPVTAGLLLGAHAIGVPFAKTALKGVASAFALNKTFKGFNMLTKSKPIRDYYAKIMIDAGRNNMASMNNNIFKLDKIIKKKNETSGKFKRIE